MCSRIDQNGNVVNYILKFSKKTSLFNPRFNIGIGQKAQFIIQPQNSYEAEEGIFGFVPAWAATVKQLYYNARSEGDKNPGNNRDYKGVIGIFDKPGFKDAIKQSRCVIPVSGFYEGPQEVGLDKPYQFTSKPEPVLLLAGLWGKHFDPKKNESISRFCIVTTTSNNATASIGHYRCPLILHQKFMETWLDKNSRQEELEAIMLARWQPASMEVIAIDPLAIKKRESGSPLALAPPTLFS